MNRMRTMAYGRTARITVFGYLLLLLVALISDGISLIKRGKNWGFGDWLINYEGGFVRRGLSGQICLEIARLLHTTPPYVILIVGISTYLIFFVYLWQLLANSSWRWWVIGMLVCPATIAFPVVSRPSYHKEILYFALLAALIVWLRRNAQDKTKDKLLSASLSFAFPVLILCHEALFAYLPYCAAALLICRRQPRRAVVVLALPFLLGSAALFLALSHQGNTEVMTKVCASLGDSVRTCSRSVQALADTKQNATNLMAGLIGPDHYYRNYSIDILLALIPAAGAYWELSFQARARDSLHLLAVAAFVSVLISIDIFRYAADWGRFIQIHLLSIALLLMLIDAERETECQQSSTDDRKLPGRKVAAAVVFVLYATCWSMPAVADWPMFGYVSLAERLIHGNRALGNSR